MNNLLSANQYISSSGIVTVYLLMIVFAVLGILIVVLTVGNKLLSAIMRGMQGAKAKRLARKQQAALPAAPVVVGQDVQQDDDAEIAAITAALAVVLQQEVKTKKSTFVVRKIERI